MKREGVWKNNATDNYDNTILNTDNFISEVYHYLSNKSSKDWIIAYTSDHGQYVKATLISKGHLMKIIILCH